MFTYIRMKQVLKDLLALPTNAERAGPLRVTWSLGVASQQQMRHLTLLLFKTTGGALHSGKRRMGRTVKRGGK